MVEILYSSTFQITAFGSTVILIILLSIKNPEWLLATTVDGMTWDEIDQHLITSTHFRKTLNFANTLYILNITKYGFIVISYYMIIVNMIIVKSYGSLLAVIALFPAIWWLFLGEFIRSGQAFVGLSAKLWAINQLIKKGSKLDLSHDEILELRPKINLKKPAPNGYQMNIVLASEYLALIFVTLILGYKIVLLV